MATITWNRLREGISRTTPAQEKGLQRVAFRLAMQTVALLLVMLLALEVVVYVITQHALLQTLETTLHDRAHPPGPPGPMFDHHMSNEPFHLRPFHDTRSSDVSTVFLDPSLHTIRGDGPLGPSVVDPGAVLQSLRTGREQCCNLRPYRGTDYLVYTAVYLDNGVVDLIGQSTISARQYESALASLRQILLLVALLGLLISSGISVVLVRRALQPIRTAIQRQRDFVADAAHELRTPLAIMRTVGEIGINDTAGENQQAAIEQMLAENKHLTRLVDDLSLLARADSQALTIGRSMVHLSSLVTDTVNELRPLAEEQGMTLHGGVPDNLWVLGDIVRLRQLLLILLDNALKHTPSGGQVHVRLSVHGHRVGLQVADSGPGIDPTDLPHIFDRFYRADRARTGEGSGLGLAIGKWIAEAHGGHIHAGNLPDHGAVFTVTLPLARMSSAT